MMPLPMQQPAASPVPPPGPMRNIPQPQQAQLNSAAPAGPGQGGAATAEGVAQSAPPDVQMAQQQAQPAPTAPQDPAAAQAAPAAPQEAPQPPELAQGGVPGWQPGVTGTLLYPDGQGPITGLAPKAASGPKKIRKKAVDSLALLKLDRLAKERSKEEEKDDEQLSGQQPNRLTLHETDQAESEPTHDTGSELGYEVEKEQPVSQEPKPMMGQSNGIGPVPATVDTPEMPGSLSSTSLMEGSPVSKFATRRSAAGEGNFKVRQEPWYRDGEDAWLTEDEYYSPPSRRDSKLPPGKRRGQTSTKISHLLPPISEAGIGFLRRCREAGCDDNRIMELAKKAAAMDPLIAEDLSFLTKEAVIGRFGRWIGKKVLPKMLPKAMGGAARRGAASATGKTAPTSLMRATPVSIGRKATPKLMPKKVISVGGKAVGGGTGGGTGGGAGGFLGGMAGGRARGAMEAGKKWVGRPAAGGLTGLGLGYGVHGANELTGMYTGDKPLGDTSKLPLYGAAAGAGARSPLLSKVVGKAPAPVRSALRSPLMKQTGRALRKPVSKATSGVSGVGLLYGAAEQGRNIGQVEALGVGQNALNMYQEAMKADDPQAFIEQQLSQMDPQAADKTRAALSMIDDGAVKMQSTLAPQMIRGLSKELGIAVPPELKTTDEIVKWLNTESPVAGSTEKLGQMAQNPAVAAMLKSKGVDPDKFSKIMSSRLPIGDKFAALENLADKVGGGAGGQGGAAATVEGPIGKILSLFGMGNSTVGSFISQFSPMQQWMFLGSLASLALGAISGMMGSRTGAGLGIGGGLLLGGLGAFGDKLPGAAGQFFASNQQQPQQQAAGPALRQPQPQQQLALGPLGGARRQQAPAFPAGGMNELQRSTGVSVS